MPLMQGGHVNMNVLEININAELLSSNFHGNLILNL